MTFQGLVVTGASRGLGAALARRFAAPGVRMLLVARSEAPLREVAAGCGSRGAAVSVAALDVADAAALAAALAAFESGGPVDLAIANAGIASGTAPDGSPESAGDAARVVAVNLLGAMHLVGPLLPGMRARGAGSVALVASLAGLRGLPDCPAYSASKAGMIAWGEALRAAESRRGIRVTVACPGFFESAMGDRFHGWKPLRLTTEQAAARVEAAIRAGRGRLAFPGPLAWLARLGAALPPGIGDRAVRGMRFRVRSE
ncbi:SDR family NAD(P)-dependent oxidoreductase [Falsiroseomonas sp. HW251]|uniref:SDR family NAD(P)-dependent oxidoreductase n=1 Tax=Falsiroseomonas sp. HW251 TaxID=3390998 RepID=UPI003D315284